MSEEPLHIVEKWQLINQYSLCSHRLVAVSRNTARPGTYAIQPTYPTTWPLQWFDNSQLTYFVDEYEVEDEDAEFDDADELSESPHYISTSGYHKRPPCDEYTEIKTGYSEEDMFPGDYRLLHRICQRNPRRSMTPTAPLQKR